MKSGRHHYINRWTTVFILLFTIGIGRSMGADSFKDVKNSFKECATSSSDVDMRCLELLYNHIKSFDQTKQRLDAYQESSTLVFKTYGIHSTTQSILYEYLERALQDKSQEHSAKAYNKLGFYYSLLSEFQKADSLYDLGLQYASDLKDRTFSIDLLSRKASLKEKQGKYEDAIDDLLMIVEKARSSNYSNGEALAHLGLGRIYGMLSIKKKSVEHFRVSAQLFLSTGDTSSFVVARVNQANSLMGLDSFTRAQEILEDVLNYLDRNKDIYIRVGCLNQLARVYDLQKLKSLSISTYKEALELAKSAGLSAQQAYSESMLAALYLSNEQIDEAMAYALSAENYYKSTDYDMESVALLEIISNIYKAKGDNRKALNYLQEFQQLNDSFNSAEKAKALFDLEQKYLKELETKDKVLLKAKLRSTRAVFGIVILLVLFGFVMLWQYIRRQAGLQRAQQQINQHKEALFKQKIKTQTAENEKLEVELAKSKRELMTAALKIAEKNDFIDQLRSQFKEIVIDRQQGGKDPLSNLKLEQSREKDWTEFLNMFSQLNPTFFGKLKEINRELSSSDLKLCSLMKLNLDSKQIASILHISDAGVKKARYRLRKKLGLNEKLNLSDYLLQID